jgi:phosphate transport system substrate-binding protein
MSEMKLQSSTKRLLGTSSVLALSAAAFLASSGTPASAQATQGIYFGGSTLASEAFRQIFDCYTGKTVGVTPTYTDGYNFDATFPGPGKLPPACTSPTQAASVQGMYAGVGSGNGVRGFIANNPQEWYGGTVTPSTTANILITTPLPATKPPLVDYANPQGTKFGSYPYPRVDVGMSDSPLGATLAALTTSSVSFNPATGWTNTGGSLSQITLNSTTAVAAYTTTVYGQPIQIPAFAVNVAIPVNVNSPLFQIKSQIRSGGNIVGGGAIQLSEGQLCAIFSGLVTNWNSTASIAYLDNAGVVQSAAFNYTNVGPGVSTLPTTPAVPYATSSLPINVVYRSDGSGTSFILTNYLKAVCPLLDNGTNRYQAIFGASNLPSTNFSALISNIVAQRGNGVWNTTTTTGARWIGTAQSSGVQSEVNDTAGSAGHIGYLSADYTKPYAIVATAPHAAALQNENQRINTITIPDAAATTLTFIPPTPDSAFQAWNDARLQKPLTTWTWNDYNIYNNTLPSSEVQGGVNVGGRSVLPLTNMAGAYPLSGTAFMDLYNCYNVQGDANRVTNLRNFLTWYINGAANAEAIVENNGFHLLPPAYTTNIRLQYLTAGPNNLRPTYIQAAGASPTNGCSIVADGANGGAK